MSQANSHSVQLVRGLSVWSRLRWALRLLPSAVLALSGCASACRSRCAFGWGGVSGCCRFVRGGRSARPSRLALPFPRLFSARVACLRSVRQCSVLHQFEWLCPRAGIRSCAWAPVRLAAKPLAACLLGIRHFHML